MAEHNFAETQQKWDRGEVSLEGCYRKGQEYRAYGWAPNGLGFAPTPEQQAAFDAGYNNEPRPFPHPDKE